MTATVLSPTPRMLASVDGPVGHLVFNQPEKLNAVSLDMWAAIPVIVDAFEADDAVKVVVVSGAGGKAFVSGADISEFKEQRTGVEATRRYEATSQAATAALAGLSKPSIARIDGFCIGGGLALALTCDIRVASSRSRFGIPAARLGLGYEYAGIRKLVHLVGHAVAREIFFAARRYDAAAALQMRLVNHVVDPDDLENFVGRLATDIAANAPLTIRAAKRAIDAALAEEGQRDLAGVQDAIDRCFASDDFVEGQTAFRERRTPLFRGR